jgi:hypothetical protein
MEDYNENYGLKENDRPKKGLLYNLLVANHRILTGPHNFHTAVKLCV